ncbi:hypothetical protein L3X38_000350 [Prunus dulcis]|uniref:Uncharacterized protein n=1 Tax=Prunus dulcis TaxID=3755 RepID=A0AAD4USR4_PRUDU|nr:hypothetical protein L3X38_000350 [Prunus dulcis]
MQLLMGLDESYASTRSNILIITPLPTTRKAYSLILQVEKQRQVATISTGTSESMSMLSLSNNNSKKHNTAKEMSSNRSPYPNDNGNASSNNQREPRHCVYCNGDIHNVKKYFFLKGFPPGHKQKEYCLYDFDNRKFMVSHDVVFHETIFIFLTPNISTTLQPTHSTIPSTDPLYTFNPTRPTTPPSPLSTPPTSSLPIQTIATPNSPSLISSVPTFLYKTNTTSALFHADYPNTTPTPTPPPPLRHTARIPQPFVLLRDFE